MRKLLALIVFLTACEAVPSEPSQPRREPRPPLGFNISVPYSDGALPDTVYVHVWTEHLPLYYRIALCDPPPYVGCATHTGGVFEMHNFAMEIAYSAYGVTGDFLIWNELGDSLSTTWEATP
jgi:hypothetical protein